MDKFYSICTFPIGLLLCFTPVLIAWLRMEIKESKNDSKKDRK